MRWSVCRSLLLAGIVAMTNLVLGCSASPEGSSPGGSSGTQTTDLADGATLGGVMPSGNAAGALGAGTQPTGSQPTGVATGAGGAATGTTPADSTGLPADGSQPSGTGGQPPATGVAVGGAAAGQAAAGGASQTAGGAGTVADTTAAGAGGLGAAGAATVGSNDGVIRDLTDYLAQDPSNRPPIAGEPFASVALSAEQASAARDLLWEDYAERVRSERQGENDAKSITLGDYTLRYDFTIFGDAPATGRSLFLSLHGGGETDAATNDSQWENQKVLYQPDEGIYLAPRGPTDTWNLWHQDHIDPLFDRLITNMIVFEGVDPNRVYVMGYSAGGDGVYQLAPRMADYWAAAAMMAGHPNDAQPVSLRNIGFTIHVGALDADFDRNLLGAEWGTMLDNLQAMDPGGYAHEVQIHEGKPHWMDLEDAVAVPWMAEFTRDPVPNQVIWLQDDVPHQRFYWLALSAVDQEAGVYVSAGYAGQEVSVDSTGLAGALEVRLSDAMLNLDQAVIVSASGEELFNGAVQRTIATLARTLEERGDPALIFSAALTVDLP